MAVAWASPSPPFNNSHGRKETQYDTGNIFFRKISYTKIIISYNKIINTLFNYNVGIIIYVVRLEFEINRLSWILPIATGLKKQDGFSLFIIIFVVFIYKFTTLFNNSNCITIVKET